MRRVRLPVRRKHFFHDPRDVEKTNTPFQESLHGYLVGSVKDRSGPPSGPQAKLSQSEAGEFTKIWRFEGERLGKRQIEPLKVGDAILRGHASAWLIGVRISGDDRCASTAPSAYETRQWTTDCGWMTTPSFSGGSANR